MRGRNRACKEKCLMAESGTVITVRVTRDGFKSVSVRFTVTMGASDEDSDNPVTIQGHFPGGKTRW